MKASTGMLVAGLVALSGCGAADREADPDAAASGPDAMRADCTRDELVAWFPDADGDGFGDPAGGVTECEQPAGYVEDDTDCDDEDPFRNPAAEELCDGLDNDCDPATVETCTHGCTPQELDERLYLLCTQGTAWLEAGVVCADAQMKLARIDSMAEEQALVAAASQLFGGNRDFYIGANDRAVDGEWRWEDGEQFWQGGSGGAAVGGLYENWRGGEPNNEGNGGALENCAIIDNDGGWDDKECDRAFRFACERY